MSMDRCAACSSLVDTDVDCSFYDFSYKINDMGGHCENCRDNIMQDMTEAQQDEHEKRIYG